MSQFIALGLLYYN